MIIIIIILLLLLCIKYTEQTPAEDAPLNGTREGTELLTVIKQVRGQVKISPDSE